MRFVSQVFNWDQLFPIFVIICPFGCFSKHCEADSNISCAVSRATLLVWMKNLYLLNDFFKCLSCMGSNGRGCCFMDRKKRAYEWSVWYCPIIFQVKFEVFPLYGMMSCGSRGIALLILENRWRWVRCFGRKSPRYPLNRKEAWWAIELVRTFLWRWKSVAPCGDFKHDYALIQPVI